MTACGLTYVPVGVRHRFVSLFGAPFVLPLVFSACEPRIQKDGDLHEDASLASARALRTVTSMVQLIATPDRYHGWPVSLRGYLVTTDNPEGRDRLHINREDGERGLDTFVDLHFVPCDQKIRRENPVSHAVASKHDRRYVEIFGEWYHPIGMDLRGAICSIDRILDLPEASSTSK